MASMSWNSGITHKWLKSQMCMCVHFSMDYSLPDSSVHWLFQARILEEVAMPSSRGLSLSRDQTLLSCIGRQILYHWTNQEAPKSPMLSHKLQWSTILQDTGEKGRLFTKVQQRLEGKIQSEEDSISQTWIRPPAGTHALGQTLHRKSFQLPFLSPWASGKLNLVYREVWSGQLDLCPWLFWCSLLGLYALGCKQ